MKRKSKQKELIEKNFDLNIEKILDHWEPCHAIREIIANAIDEQILSSTQNVEIYKTDTSWCIRDYGRGLKQSSLTQNENPEKLKSKNVIGKFGIGLKDALATFDKHNHKVSIKSSETNLTTAKLPKLGFPKIRTLHAILSKPKDKKFAGTLFTIEGIKDSDMHKAKNLFLLFSGEVILETTRMGQIMHKKSKFGNIYINGVKVAEEENFIFSYNITSPTASIKKALNRERTNVGRSAYTDCVKKLLLSANSTEVATILGKDLENMSTGYHGDELHWIDIQEHAVRILNTSKKCLFLSTEDIANNPDMVSEARNNNYEIISIPENLRDRIEDVKDINGRPVMGLNQFVDDYNGSFQFEFVDIEKLTKAEKAIFNQTTLIFKLIGGKPSQVKHVKITSKMRNDFSSMSQTLGVWDEKTKSIIILRSQLRRLSDYSGTLIHEAIHAISGLEDVTREFENELTKAIGVIVEKAL